MNTFDHMTDDELQDNLLQLAKESARRRKAQAENPRQFEVRQTKYVRISWYEESAFVVFSKPTSR